VPAGLPNLEEQGLVDVPRNAHWYLGWFLARMRQNGCYLGLPPIKYAFREPLHSERIHVSSCNEVFCFLLCCRKKWVCYKAVHCIQI